MKYVVKLPMIDCLIFKIGPSTFGYRYLFGWAIWSAKWLPKYIYFNVIFFHTNSRIMLNYCVCLGVCARACAAVAHIRGLNTWYKPYICKCYVNRTARQQQQQQQWKNPSNYVNRTYTLNASFDTNKSSLWLCIATVLL